jgi:hypothetical protein
MIALIKASSSVFSSDYSDDIQEDTQETNIAIVLNKLDMMDITSIKVSLERAITSMAFEDGVTNKDDIQNLAWLLQFMELTPRQSRQMDKLLSGRDTNKPVSVSAEITAL